VSNLYYWSNIGFDALNKAAGFSWRERRRIRRMRAEDLERQRAESDNAVAKR